MQAAKDTAGLIGESVESAGRGTARVQAVEGAIAAVTESARQLRTLVDGVSLASREQTQGIGQVTQAISQMERVTQTTAATAEESAAAAEELQAQAQGSLQVVERLELLVDGADGAGRARHPGTARTTRVAKARAGSATSNVVILSRTDTRADSGADAMAGDSRF